MSVHGLERYVTLLITFVLFWGCVCDVVHQPHQPAESKPSIRPVSDSQFVCNALYWGWSPVITSGRFC